MDESGDDTGERLQPVDLRKVALLTGTLGAAFSVLFLASMWVIGETPGPGATDQALVDFYASEDKRRVTLVGLYLLPLAAVAFLWFISLLREWVSASSRRQDRMLGNVQLISGIGFITLVFAAAAASTVMAVAVELTDAPIDPTEARQFPIYGDALLLIFAMRMAAIFVVSTTNVGRIAGVFPLWFVVASFAVAAVLFLSASLAYWLVLVFPIWVLALAALILFKAQQVQQKLRAPPRAGGGSVLRREVSG
jgi:hypothetical protein